MTQKCVQCNREFHLSDSEINFYKSKDLNLPKRCKACRDKNKHGNQEFKKYNMQIPVKNRSTFLSAIFSVLIFINGIGIGFYGKLTPPLFFIDLVGIVAIFLLFAIKFTVEIQEFDTSPYRYTFYDTKSMAEHYAKHGKETNCRDMEEYLYKANFVIGNKSAISKTQKEDGDKAYFNTSTNEFVVVAKAGYIRTYFIASLSYYNKQ